MASTTLATHENLNPNRPLPPRKLEEAPIALDFRRDVRGIGAGFVAALFVGDSRADVPRRIITVGCDGHKGIRSRGFGGQLIFHEAFPRQMQ